MQIIILYPNAQSLGIRSEKIKVYREDQRDHKTNQRENTYELWIRINAKNFVSKIFDEWRRQILFSKFLFYCPLPIGEKTISPTVPVAQYKPWESCQQYCDKVYPSRAPPYPANQIEKRKNNVKKTENEIKDMQHRTKIRSLVNNTHLHKAREMGPLYQNCTVPA